MAFNMMLFAALIGIAACFDTTLPTNDVKGASTSALTIDDAAQPCDDVAENLQGYQDLLIGADDATIADLALEAKEIITVKAFIF